MQQLIFISFLELLKHLHLMKVLHLLLFKKKSIYFKITDFFNTNDIKAVQIAQPLSDPSFSLLASIK